MEAGQSLKILLQLQLASDQTAAIHLPHILATLTPELLFLSPHLSKWTTRLTSLLHSKDSAARWAGLCLASKTSILSRNIMTEFALTWIGLALPMLAKNEPTPNVKAAIRLLKILFTAALDVPEFQRQVATPNVPKFTLALLSLGEKTADAELRVLILCTFAKLVPAYPTLHRPSHVGLSALSLKFLNGTAPNPTSELLLQAASRLYTVLHCTGGKVGAANLWRKSVDDTLSFAWGAFIGIRTTFSIPGHKSQSHSTTTDPLLSVPLHLDRLRCSIVVLCHLLRSNTPRAVQAPLGALVTFAITLLGSTDEEQIMGHVDPAVRAIEISAIPVIWKYSCDLIQCLAQCAHRHLTPKLTLILSYIAFHLEQKNLTSSQRLSFMATLQILLTRSHPVHSPLLPTRLVKAILPSITAILATKTQSEPAENTAGRIRKGKKRARGYEGDELFKVMREVICPTVQEGSLVLSAIDVLQLLMRNSSIAPAVHSVSSRLLMSILLSLPQISPGLLSPDLALHSQLLGRLQSFVAEFGCGTSSEMSGNLGLVIGTIVTDGSGNASTTAAEHTFDLLLHPRLPPLLRPLRHVETMSLFRAEEGQEENDIREALGIAVIDQPTIELEKETEVVDTVVTTQVVMEKRATVVSQTIPVPILRASPMKTSTEPQMTRTAAPSIPEVARTAPATQFVPEMDDDDDEEMPAIDINSDSD